MHHHLNAVLKLLKRLSHILETRSIQTHCSISVFVWSSKHPAHIGSRVV